MENTQTKPDRRKVLGWLTIFSVVTAVGGSLFFKKKQKVKTIKMLTQDGKLVEVDASLIHKTGKKISNLELQNWIGKK